MLQKLKKRVCEANIKLGQSDLVVHTWGNVSGIDRKSGHVVIKPSGVPYQELTPEKMVVVDLNNNKIKGILNPSSDTKTHTLLYQKFPKIGGVCHTHSPFAVSWAQAKRAIPCFGTTHADYSPVEIPCTNPMTDKQIKGDYERETGQQILATFKGPKYNCKYTPMVIVASHGPFTWGDGPEQALYHAIALEEVAKMALNTILINPGTKQASAALRKKHFCRKHGKNAYYGQRVK